jgi:hypothetical protein
MAELLPTKSTMLLVACLVPLAELLETTVGMLRKVLRDYACDRDSDVWQAEAVASRQVGIDHLGHFS